MQQHIRQSNLIEGIDDQREDNQSMKVWLWLLNQSRLSHTVICQLQKRITANQTDLRSNQRGYYRDESKVIPFIRDTSNGDIERVAPDWRLVKGLMDNWLLDYKGLGPLGAHIRFEKIHPFVDGNGRTGRMLMWWQELHTGGLPTIFYAHEREEKYYPLFR